MFAVVLQVAVGLAVALLFNNEFPGREFCRALILLPWVLPMVSAANAWLWILNPVYGVVNGVLLNTGIIREPLQFLSEPNAALATVILIKVWKAFPFATLLIMAGLSNIPKERYEAAMIDGATMFQRFFYITLPGLKQVLLMILLLQTIWTFNDITTIYLLTAGGPGKATTSLPILVYQVAFQAGNLSLGAAGAMLMFVIAGLLIFAYFRLYARNEENARG
jgi:multiple sugar transport system permease protein